ncbi:MAG: rod shape-determining protein MreC [Treponemataceae bacterium]|nr:rod shape-determining protein MreC [Treponemataceae bacterium]
MVQEKTSAGIRFPIILMLILSVISGVVLGLSTGGFIVDFNELGFSVFSTAQRSVNSVSTSVGGVFTAVKQLATLKEEHAALTEKLKDYEYLQRNNAEIRKENERLREQLGLSDSLNKKNYPAFIIGRDPNANYSAITINKGSKAGIKKNMPVIALQRGNVGLVGKVVEVGLYTSLVMPIYDYQCNVSARIQNTRDLGLVSGNGSETQNLSLKYIKKRVLDELQFGDIIVTSGENGNYERDIPIGSISKISVLDYDSSLEIEVTPIIDFSRLESVLVMDKEELND